MLTGFLTFRAFRFAAQAYERRFGDLADLSTAPWEAKIAVTAIFEQPLLLVLILTALVLRSGAVIWLSAWFLASSALPLIGASLGVDATRPATLALVIYLLAGFAIASLLVYLVRTGELRKP